MGNLLYFTGVFKKTIIMKKLLILITVLALGGSFYSCKKKYTVVPPPTPTSSIWDSINFYFVEAEQQFSFNGAAGGDFVTASGIQFHVPYFTFRDGDGDTVTGTVNVTLTEILTPADMIRMNKPTTSDNNVLVTGGQFKINFTVNDNPVYISGDTVVYCKVPTDVASSSMKLFDGVEDNTGFVNWLPSIDTSGNPQSTPIDIDTVNGLIQNYYLVELDTFNSNWINCDYFYTSTSPQTNITLNLPSLHNNTNTLFFLHFSDFQSVMSGYYDGNNFVTPGTIPVGTNVTLVIISEIDGNYYSTFEDIIVNSGYSASITPDPTTYSDMVNTIVNL